tara:strand:- start:2555 stop:2725 length:171 start_codon:yes stop_codon:yes gene_type:complete
MIKKIIKEVVIEIYNKTIGNTIEELRRKYEMLVILLLGMIILQLLNILAIIVLYNK